MEGNENVVGLLTDIKELLSNKKKTMNLDDLVRYTGLSMLTPIIRTIIL